MQWMKSKNTTSNCNKSLSGKICNCKYDVITWFGWENLSVSKFLIKNSCSLLKEMKRLSDVTDNAVDKITRCKIFNRKRLNLVQI